MGKSEVLRHVSSRVRMNQRSWKKGRICSRINRFGWWRDGDGGGGGVTQVKYCGRTFVFVC